jgi:hypothetical protein
VLGGGGGVGGVGVQRGEQLGIGYVGVGGMGAEHLVAAE